MNSSSKKRSPRRPILGQKSGRVALLLLVVTLVLILLLAAAFAVSLMLEKEETGEPTDRDSGSPSVPAGVDEPQNLSPLFPTKPSRTSYRIDNAPSIQTISGIQSNNAILVELGAYKAIAEKEADQKIYPASMTKVMTILVASERLTSLTELLEVPQKHVSYAISQEGSGVGMQAGEKQSVKTLLYLISYESDTVASLMIADYIAGSEQAFVDLMNQKAKEIGLQNTHFANCTGLHDEQNYSTCRDIAALMAYALDNEMAKKVLTITANTQGYAAVIGGKEVTVFPGWYTDRFNWKNELQTVTVMGGKTGYTDESGFCLVSYAVSETGKKYINVIVGKPKGNGLTATQSTKDVKHIYDTYAT